MFWLTSFGVVFLVFFFFFSSRRRHTRCREVSWARRCVQETEKKHLINFQSKSCISSSREESISSKQLQCGQTSHCSSSLSNSISLSSLFSNSFISLFSKIWFKSYLGKGIVSRKFPEA
eukprot:TRINITY_DN7856_c0_g2_i2.p4 TRINITY_DN7856_c0_g2~~TRINITY_DN7856_c0_g2_i2.p4  ORF type:complete len:119 (-),score=23.88 TRINITY_DN7856_c0_g2_i2:415-771(-)